MADKTFAANLKAQIEAKPKKTPKERRLLNALNDDTPGPLRRQRLAVAEEHAKAVMGLTGPVDWSQVEGMDWKAFLGQIVEFILKLFKLFA